MSFILLNRWNGRFGNRMHQYAYGVTYARLRNVDFILPSDWEGTKLFKTQHHKVLDHPQMLEDFKAAYPQRAENPGIFLEIAKKHYPTIKEIHPESSWGYYYDSKPRTFNSVCAYQQGATRSTVPTIFIPQSRKHLLDVFEFSDEVKDSESYRHWYSRKGTYDVAHLRRGDIASGAAYVPGINGYSVISLDSYYRAFEKFGFNKDKIEWISDDRTKKWHQDRPEAPKLGFTYPEGSEYKPGIIFDWLDDFLKIYFARTVFRGNSSFSWWANFLSEAKTYAPLLDKKVPYGENRVETDFEFVDGNYPHWHFAGQNFEPWQIIVSH
jgi:hypothetical protein